MSDLSKQKCVPCTVGTPPLKGIDLQKHLDRLEEGWTLQEEKELEKTYRFKDFKEGLNFVNQLGKIAEEEGHHPDLHLTWGKVTVSLTTHKIKGLSESDFVMAAKSDVIYLSMKE